MTLTEQQAVLQILICIACNANLRSSRSVVGSHVPLIAGSLAHAPMSLALRTLGEVFVARVSRVYLWGNVPAQCT